MSMIVPVPFNYASDPEAHLGFMVTTQSKEGILLCFTQFSLIIFFSENSMGYCHWIFLAMWPVASNDKLSAKKRLGGFSIW